MESRPRLDMTTISSVGSRLSYQLSWISPPSSQPPCQANKLSKNRQILMLYSCLGAIRYRAGRGPASIEHALVHFRWFESPGDITARVVRTAHPPSPSS